jgi:hypothetical protein
MTLEFAFCARDLERDPLQVGEVAHGGLSVDLIRTSIFRETKAAITRFGAFDSFRVLLFSAAIFGFMAAPRAEAQSYHSVGSGVSPAFSSPRGVVVDSSGNVFVSDSSSTVDREPVSAFRKITPTTTGNPITPYSYAGASATYIAGTSTTNSPFDTVEQITMDSSGNIYAADIGIIFGIGTVWKIAPPYSSATSVTAIANYCQSGAGDGSNGVGTPNGVAVDSAGNLFVADSTNNTVTEFLAPNYTSSTRIYSSGNENSFFTGLAVDGSNNVYLTDAGLNTVQEFTKSSNYATVVTIASGSDGLNFPISLVVDPGGEVFVLNDETGDNDQLIKISADHASTSVLAVPSGGFNDPNQIALDKSGNLLVGNTGDDTVVEGLLGVTVSSISVAGGPIGGGTSVTITGTQFASGATVRFGANAATNVVFDTATSMTATSPAGSPGTVDVTVTTPAGISFPSANDQFTYSGVATTTTVSSSVNPATASQSETFTATVTSSSTVSEGTVEFESGGSAISGCSAQPVTSGIATCTTQLASNASNYSIVAVYAGDSNFATSTSASLSQKVNSFVSAAVSIPSAILDENTAVSFQPIIGGGGTGALAYSIDPALPDGLGLDPSSGFIGGTPTQAHPNSSFTVTVTDQNGQPASNSFNLTINPPVAAAQTIAAEALTQSHPASFTPVTGSGGTAPLAFSISPGLPTGLSISGSTGAISGTPSVTHAASSFTVTVMDNTGATASNSFSLTVNAAPTAAQAVATKTLTQNQPSTSFTPVTGGSGTPTLVYSISPPLPGGLGLSATTGAISGAPTTSLAATPFTVTVTDQNGATAAAGFSLTVNPAVTATQSIATKSLTLNHAASFTPVTGGGGTTPLAYSISPTPPSGLSIDPTTGVISGIPGATLTATLFTVTATDANLATASNTFSLTVNSAVTATQSVATKILTQSQAANFTPVTGGGGTTPLAFSISPTLPSGLSIDPITGAVTGTPGTTLTATTFTVTVTDANSATATNTFSLTVNAAVTATQSVATTLLTLNHAVTGFTPVTGSGGTGTLGYSISPTLPAGLSFSPTTGAVTGDPSATSAATTYTVTVTDANAATATNTFSLTVNGVPTATQSIASEVLTQNHATGFTPVTGGGGTAPLGYSISPTLPTGLSIDPMTGIVSGTPSGTSTATTYTVTVTDANNATANASFSLAVNTAVTATRAVASKALTQNLAAVGFTPVTGAGGTTPLAYSISPALPTGLSINATTGAVSGSPSTTLTATSFTVTVADANGATATASFSLTVNTAPTATLAVSSATLTASHATTPFTPVTGAGGTGSLTYSVSPTLPTGLSVGASTGQLTGTPAAASAATSYTVTVTDSNGATATNSFSLTVDGPVTATQVIASKGLTVNFATSGFTPVTGAGGVGTLSYSVSPTLPAGIAMNPSTGQITGLPTNPTAATTYTVTVTDQNGATAPASFSLMINGQVTATQAVASTALTQDRAAVSFTPVTAGGGTMPVSFSVSPVLPAGLTLASATGTVAGTPTVASATTSYTVTVTDLNGATATAGFSLTVNQAVTATQAVAMTSLKVNQAATPLTPVTGSGGTGALSYAVAPALPTGLSLASATGEISGTPTAPQAAASYTVTVTDTNGATATASFSLAITTTTSSVAVTTSANPSSYGQAVTFTASVSGSGATPTGTVTFKDGSTTLFTGTLAQAISSYTSSTLSPGTHSISVAYSGDNIFTGSSGRVEQLVGGAATTPGQAYRYTGTLPGFLGPAESVYDTVNDHLLIDDAGADTVQVLSAETLAVVATLGTNGIAGSDNAHFNAPSGVTFDAATDQIFVADTGNDRVQVFNAESFAYVETIGISPGASGTSVAAAGNASFAAPSGMYVNAANSQLYVADTGNQRVQIFDATTLAYIGTLGTVGAAGSDNGHFNAPKGVTADLATNEIRVADSGNGRVQRFDAASFAYKGTIGGPGPSVGNSDYLASPAALAYDAASNLVLVADPGQQRVEVFDALGYTYVLTLGTTGSTGSGSDQFDSPAGIAIDTSHGTVYIADQNNNRIQIFSIMPTVAFASVLPGSRSVELGKPATIFASVINAGTTPLQGCQVLLPVTAPSGLSLSYQTTNPATNALTGTADTPATIAGTNGIQSFLVTLQGSQAFSTSGMALDFDCLGIGPAAVETGVDTVDLAMSNAPVADVIALSATVSNNGIAELPAGGAGAFAVASTNIGATSQIVVSVDTGSASLPLTATLCQSNPGTGACLATPSSTVTLSDAAGAAPTFSVFLEANGTIPFAPATSRVFVRFKDPAGGLHGSTSVAVETQ